ncbi:MAG: hypothetical protein Q9180_008734, partial [Flavoplaca navasiana]
PDNPTKIPNSDMGVYHDLLSQLIYKPPFPSTSFANKTIPFAGANTGLGREAETVSSVLALQKSSLRSVLIQERTPTGSRQKHDQDGDRSNRCLRSLRSGLPELRICSRLRCAR